MESVKTFLQKSFQQKSRQWFIIQRYTYNFYKLRRSLLPSTRRRSPPPHPPPKMLGKAVWTLILGW